MKKRLLTSIASAAMLTTVATPVVDNVMMTTAHSQKVSAATTDEQAAFLNKAAKQAVKAAKKYGTYPSVMIAQAILESGWGQSALATEANNLFGMKADNSWPGGTYSAKTREEGTNGKSYYIVAKFRKYNSFEESFEDNGKKLREGVSWQPLRYKGTWLENANTYADATKSLTGTYATDSKYDSSLNSRITDHNLNQYDPIVSKTAKVYTVSKSGSVYNWPTDHSVASPVGTVKKGERVVATKTITYNDGSTRMYLEGKGWINGTSLGKGNSKSSEPITQAPKGATKVDKTLMHNAYVYDDKGTKIKGKMFKLNEEEDVKMISTYGTKIIKGKTYYRVGENEYIAAGNIDGTLKFLKRNSYVYNQYGNRDNSLKRKKNEQVATYGTAVTINGKKYYRIGIRQYIKKANFMQLERGPDVKLRKKLITLIAAISLTGVATNTGVNIVQADSINAQAKKYQYSGVTYLYKMLKLEGIKYNKFPGVEYKTGKPEGIVIHETADPGATAHDEAIYFNREWPKVKAYVHAFVDDDYVIQMRSPEMGTWGAGPNANDRFIQIELCEENTRGAFIKSINNDAIYVAKLLHRYDLKPDNACDDGEGTIWSHHAVSTYLGGTDHVDPDGYFEKWGYSMDQFFDLIQYYYDLQAKDTDAKEKDPAKSKKDVEAIQGAVTLGHDAYIYDAKGKNTKKIKKAGSPVVVMGYKAMNNNKYYQIGKNQYVVASNIDATDRVVKKDTYLRTNTGRIEPENKVKKGSRVLTYGSRVTIKGQKYYALNATQFILVSDIE